MVSFPASYRPKTLDDRNRRAHIKQLESQIDNIVKAKKNEGLKKSIEKSLSNSSNEEDSSKVVPLLRSISSSREILTTYQEYDKNIDDEYDNLDYNSYIIGDTLISERSSSNENTDQQNDLNMAQNNNTSAQKTNNVETPSNTSNIENKSSNIVAEINDESSDTPKSSFPGGRKGLEIARVKQNDLYYEAKIIESEI
jgi:hypothetical protein